MDTLDQQALVANLHEVAAKSQVFNLEDVLLFLRWSKWLHKIGSKDWFKIAPLKVLLQLF